MTAELVKLEKPKRNKPAFNKLVNSFVGNYLSKATREGYRHDVEQFVNWSRQRGYKFNHPNELTSDIFRQYRDFMLNDMKFKNATCMRKMVAVRSLLQWCFNEGLIDRNPLLNVRLPKVDKVASTLDYTDEEVRRLLKIPKRNKPAGSLHYLVLILLFYLGPRKAEICNIRLNDIYDNGKHRVLRLRGKGDKVREVPLTAFVQSAIENYLTMCGRAFDDDSYLLQSVQKRYLLMERPLHPTSVNWIISKYNLKAGITKQVSPHSARATVVGNLLDQRVPIRDVANLMGHESLNTTNRYDRRKQNLDKSAAFSVRY